VDELMASSPLSVQEHALISERLDSMSLHLETALTQVSSLMSSLIDYTTIVMVPTIYQDALKLVHMVLVDINRVLVILLHALGVNHEFILTLDDQVAQEDLTKLSQLLTSKLEGLNIQDIRQEFFIELVSDLPDYRSVLDQLSAEIIKLNEHHQSNQGLLLSGTSKMLKLPEFRNIEFTQQVLSAVEENKVLLELLQRALVQSNTNQSCFIGKSDHQVELLDGCSVILKPVSIGESYSTVIGVLGPTRMSYSAVTSKLTVVSDMVSDYLSQNILKGGSNGSNY
jgi:heat-inducible transcriptional repressor